jgi:hypothetical protein
MPLQVVVASGVAAAAGIVPAVVMAASATHARARLRARALPVIDGLPLPRERAGLCQRIAEGG